MPTGLARYDRRYRDGVMPTARRKFNVKCAWLEKPQRTAMSANDRVEWRSISCARAMRRAVRSRCGETPTVLRNVVAK